MQITAPCEAIRLIRPPLCQVELHKILRYYMKNSARVLIISSSSNMLKNLIVPSRPSRSEFRNHPKIAINPADAQDDTIFVVRYF